MIVMHHETDHQVNQNVNKINIYILIGSMIIVIIITPTLFITCKSPLLVKQTPRSQDLDFYALTMPYQDTVLVTVWRQLGDVVAAEYRHLAGPADPAGWQDHSHMRRMVLEYLATLYIMILQK